MATDQRLLTNQSDWSKVSLYHSPSFLSKNQLAKQGPDSVVPSNLPANRPGTRVLVTDHRPTGFPTLTQPRPEEICYHL